MTAIATKRRDIEALREIITNKSRIEALRDKIKRLEDATDVAEAFLKARHPDGLALQTTAHKAKIVEFTVIERKYVNMLAVKKLLKTIPTRTVKVSMTRVVDARVEE